MLSVFGVGLVLVKMARSVKRREKDYEKRTVSLKDIFNHPLGSVPQLTAFTNLSSPDIGATL